MNRNESLRQETTSIGSGENRISRLFRPRNHDYKRSEVLLEFKQFSAAKVGHSFSLKASTIIIYL